MLGSLLAAFGSSSASGDTGTDAGQDSAAEVTSEAESAEEETESESGTVDATDPSNPYNLSDETLDMIQESWDITQEQIDDGMLPGPDADGVTSIRGVTYNYPLEGSHELSIWAVFNGNLTNWLDGYGDLRAWIHVQEATGISLSFVSVSEDVATTQYSLMIASGDYSDIINGFGSSMTDSTMTAATACDEGIIICLDDYMEDYLPNYSAWLAMDEAYQRDTKDDDGHYYGTYTLNTQAVSDSGNWLRSDLLEKYGADSLSTVADYEDFFAFCKSEGLEQVVGFNQNTLTTYMASAYDLAGLSDAALFQVDGVVKSSYLEDAAYDYMAMIVDWYQKGYIDDDVMSITGAPNDSIFTESIYTGNLALFNGMGGHYSDYCENAADVEGFDLVAVPELVLNEGSITHFDEPIAVKTDSCTVITTGCDDIEAAAKLLDWFYSDDGINTGNYGAEGTTWYWDADGHRQYTELIWNDTEFGLIPSNISGIYCLQGRFDFGYPTPVVLDAMETWSSDSDDAYYLNTSTISLTTDEEDIVNSYLSDLSTYAEENLSKVAVGDIELTEAWWSDFTDTLLDMGLQEIIDQYQAGYTRYLSR